MHSKYPITVGIPFYNKTHPEHLKMSVNSILTQTIKIERLHLIQDGPINDELDKLIKKYKEDNPSIIKILVLPKRGLPHGLNESIKLSNTKYYARMDADDISFQNRLQVQFDFLEKNKDTQILGAWAVEFETDYNERFFLNKRPNDIKKINEYFHYMNPLIHSTVMFRTIVFNELGYYNSNFYTDQDLELWGRALKNKIHISNIQEPLLYLRVLGRQDRRSQTSAIKRQLLARYSYNTPSIKLNILKICAIIFRILPKKIREWSYKNLRNN